jgi:hypothetical protein
MQSSAFNARKKKSSGQRNKNQNNKSINLENNELLSSNENLSTSSADSIYNNSPNMGDIVLDFDTENENLRNESELPTFYWFQRAAIDAAIN